jgi:putative transposase
LHDSGRWSIARTACRPNEKWVADISYIWTAQGWLYLAAIIDLYARRVVGWSTSDRLHRDLALRALNMACVRRRPPPGLIHHSDRGSQYASWEYQKTLKAHSVLASMSGKGNCYDNAAMESFFKTIKSELVWRTRFLSRRQAHDMIGHYIESFCNPQRLHSTLGYLSPVQFEKMTA